MTSRHKQINTHTPTHSPPHRKWLGVRVGGSRNRGGGGSVIRGEYVRIIGRIRWDPRRILPHKPPLLTPFLPPLSCFLPVLSETVPRGVTHTSFTASTQLSSCQGYVRGGGSTPCSQFNTVLHARTPLSGLGERWVERMGGGGALEIVARGLCLWQCFSLMSCGSAFCVGYTMRWLGMDGVDWQETTILIHFHA